MIKLMIDDLTGSTQDLKETTEIGIRMIDILITREDSIDLKEKTSREETKEETKIEIINLNKVQKSGNFIMEISKVRSVEESMTNPEVSIEQIEDINRQVKQTNERKIENYFNETPKVIT
jgi:hypothetical protein